VNYHGDLWGDLRAMRSNPAGYAATDDARRAVFLAALEQSEQLLRSARGLGYATRPLNLFYGLSQAGRAISAAWCPPEQGAHQSWRLSSHGIKARALTGEMEAITVVGDHMSKKLHKDSPRPTFSGVAAALGSDTMTQPTSLLDLWACLPEAIGRPARGDDGRFGPVQIQQPSFLPQDAETTVGAVAADTQLACRSAAPVGTRRLGDLQLSRPRGGARALSDDERAGDEHDRQPVADAVARPSRERSADLEPRREHDNA